MSPEPEVEKQIWKLWSFKEKFNIQINSTEADIKTGKINSMVKEKSIFKEVQRDFKDFLKSNETKILSESKDRLDSCIATIQLFESFNFLLTKVDKEPSDIENLVKLIDKSMKSPLFMTFEFLEMFSGYFEAEHHIQKILITIMEICLEKMKKLQKLGYRNSEYQNDVKDKDELNALVLYTMKICHIKVMTLQTMFLFSISIYVDKEVNESPELLELEYKIGVYFMEIVKNAGDEYAYDSDFLELPSRVKNYEHAEKAAKHVTKNCNKRLEIHEKENFLKNMTAMEEFGAAMFNIRMLDAYDYWRKQKCVNDKIYYSGLVYYYTAKFHKNDSVKFKMMLKCLENWITFDIETTNDPALKTMYLNYKGECYQFMWQYKYKVYLKNRNQKCFKNLKIFAEKRIQVGEQYLEHIKTRRDRGLEQSHYSYMRYDMMKAAYHVLNDEIRAKRYAREMAFFLAPEPKRAKNVAETFNIVWTNGISNQEFAENIFRSSDLHFCPIY